MRKCKTPSSAQRHRETATFTADRKDNFEIFFI